MLVVRQLVEALQRDPQFRALGFAGEVERLRRRVQELVGQAARELIEDLIGRHAAGQQPSRALEFGGTQLVGVRGATKLVFTGGASMLLGEGAGRVGLSGITLDGQNIPLPQRRGLVHCRGGRDVRITDCDWRHEMCDAFIEAAANSRSVAS